MSSKEDLIRAIQEHQSNLGQKHNQDKQVAGRVSSDVADFYKMLESWMAGIPWKCSRSPSTHPLFVGGVRIDVDDFLIEGILGVRVVFTPVGTDGAVSFQVTGLGDQWEEMKVVDNGHHYELQGSNRVIISVFTDEVLYDRLTRLISKV